MRNQNMDTQGIGPTSTIGKRRSACTRCRGQKVRCDGQRPACSNCLKSGSECIRTRGSLENALSNEYIQRLEKRTRWLEEVVRSVRPDISLDERQEDFSSQLGIDQSNANQVLGKHPPNTDDHKNLDQSTSALKPVEITASPAANSPAVSNTSQIGPTQPLAHDVGLLSLGNSTEPKYLGPSSGVTFARLIFAAAPQTQGLSSILYNADDPRRSNGTGGSSNIKQFSLMPLPSEDETQYFVDAYFETWQPFYPFLHPDSFNELLSECYKQEAARSQFNGSTPQDDITKPIEQAQAFLVLALGAKTLEHRLGKDFNADQYYATAMYYVGRTQLHDSLAGIQVLLLLVLSSFSFTNGLNAWFLSSTIIASCIDLGLQRKQVMRLTNEIPPHDQERFLQFQNIRSGIFWSAYSLDRSLTVVLGRPLTLRDEAIDNEFPGEHESTEVDHNAVRKHGSNIAGQDPEPPPKRMRLDVDSSHSSFKSANYSFRFDRITAEIKLMIHRVAQSPERFPWPTNLLEWQHLTHQTCSEILEELRHDFKYRRGVSGLSRTSDGILQGLELKYHQCLMLLFRPSPALPQPTATALNVCYESAVETIRINSELDRFGKLVNSWYTAHTVFISGITMLYCVWTSPKIRYETTLKSILPHANACIKLLQTLGATWSVAEDAHQKYERLVQITRESWKQAKSGTVTPAHQNVQQPMMDPDTTQGKDMDFLQIPENLPPDFWDSIDTDYSQGPNLIMDELGDMGNWFDLDWLGDSSSMYPFTE